MTLDLYVICWNEIAIAKWAIDYWKRAGVRHVYVYDNGSNDGCLELFAEYPDWITVTHYDSTEGKLDDDAIRRIKNEAWKGSDADYVWVGDFDEFPYSSNMIHSLADYKQQGVTIIEPKWMNVCCEVMPEYHRGNLLHMEELVRAMEWESRKATILSPKDITEMNYSAGAHTISPQGNVVVCKCEDIYVLHSKDLGYEYLLKRLSVLRDRMSSLNRKKGWGVHYLYSKDKIIKDLTEHLARSVSIYNL